MPPGDVKETFADIIAIECNLGFKPTMHLALSSNSVVRPPVAAASLACEAMTALGLSKSLTLTRSANRPGNEKVTRYRNCVGRMVLR